MCCVTQEHAQRATDGADGWSVLFVVCHLCDFEQIFYERLQMTLTEDNPHLPKLLSPDELTRVNRYADQDLGSVLATYLERRQRFIAALESLSADQWLRRGVHPSFGEYNVMEFAINTGLHDVNHTHQIINALNFVGA